jgi:hypothetical protein
MLIMDSWKIYGLTVVVLFVKMFAVVLVQGYGRYKHRGFTNPEDAVMFDNSYLKAIQPWRNLSYQLGLWTTFAMAGHIVWQSTLAAN